MTGFARALELDAEMRKRDEELHDATVEKCARAIEGYHAGPQTVGIILANVIRKLKISMYKIPEAESP